MDGYNYYAIQYEHCADVLSALCEYVRCRYDCGYTIIMLCLAGTVSGWVGIYYMYTLCRCSRATLCEYVTCMTACIGCTIHTV